MRAVLRGPAAVAAAAALALGACSGNGSATNAPAGGTNPPAATQAATVCEEPDDAAAPADVDALVSNNEWGPVGAKVDEVITWTNDDGVPHRVVLDDGSCSMEGNIAGHGTRSLIFTKSGIYAFHCGVHPSMQGNIVIS